jgi:hypothetical protein
VEHVTLPGQRHKFDVHRRGVTDRTGPVKVSWCLFRVTFAPASELNSEIRTDRVEMMRVVDCGRTSDRPVRTAGRSVNDADRRLPADDDGGGPQPRASAIPEICGPSHFGRYSSLLH